MQLLWAGLLAYLATVGFGIILNIPRRALNIAGLIGLTGWVVYTAIEALPTSYKQLSLMALGMLAASIAIGWLSSFAARHKHMPVILFNIPSLVPLVPGGQAYQMVRNLVLGQMTEAMGYLGQVVVVAGTIALGFLLAELSERVWRRGQRRWKLTQNH
ncbi:threonine/serine exporter family protein [Furfurilactobacillus curtus]|uniref:Membrane protein n=1 Tax=Furfurilactobacillus curtus TaxID=1746200 RepID=A0ABQ5JVC9_9LACO